MGRRSPVGRVGAALAAAAATMLLAVPASADVAKGKVVPNEKGEGHALNFGGKYSEVQPSLFTLQLDGGSKLRVYCVEFYTGLRDDKTMVEVPWDAYPSETSPFRKNNAKVSWVLHHGYPHQSIDELKKLDGLGDLDAEEAISATQAAVWFFSDDVTLVRENPSKGDDAADADILKFYDYLTGEKNTGIQDKPAPELQISPESATGVAGDKIGPFKVTTNGPVSEVVASLPDGVKLTDKDGKAIAAADIKNDTELFLTVPADAAADKGSFVLTGLSKVETGRLFVVENYSDANKGQSLIVADSSDLKVQASAKAEWKAAPVTVTTTPTTETTTTTVPPTTTTTAPPVPQGGNLPDTGASILTPVLIGVGLLGVGAGALIYQRRRRSA